MSLICSELTLTWYPGEPGDTDDPLVLLSPSDLVDEGSLPTVLASQLSQEVDYVRGTSGAAFARGSVRTSISWETVRQIDDPMGQAEAALTSAAGLPSLVGWVRIQLARKTAQWQIPGVVLNNVGGRPQYKKGYLLLPWSISGGRISLYSAGEDPPTIYTPGELLESGPSPTDRGAVLLSVAE